MYQYYGVLPLVAVTVLGTWRACFQYLHFIDSSLGEMVVLRMWQTVRTSLG